MKNEIFYTTGTYAASASKAALIKLLNNVDSKNIEMELPNKEKASIAVSYTNKSGGNAKASVIKISVEEADITHNMEIVAQVSFREDNKIVIDGGKGVGRITKPGLQLPIGEAAINPVPREMISSVINKLTDRGVNIIISAPEGVEIAHRTTNSRLGIMGGISIIGTTGVMKPKSVPAYKQTIYGQLQFCKKNNVEEIIIAPGNISEKAMQTLFRDRFQDHQLAQSGDYLGFTLKHAHKMNLSILLAGHPGKLAKVLSGHFQTHFTKSPPANEAVLGFLINKVEEDVLEELKESTTVEGMITILKKQNKKELLNDLAEEIEKRILEYLQSKAPVPVLLFNMNKELVGASETGKDWIAKK